MEKGIAIKQNFLNELHSKWVLTDMKSKLVQTICNLMDDEMYTKDDAVYAMLEVVALIELEEKKVYLHEVKDKLGH